MERFSFDIDVAGACNLRCPCCPQGNYPELRLPRGFMEPALLSRVLEKALAECEVEGVSLFNWTEPLLHPRLPELVRIVRQAGLPCHLSSNLNLLPDADAVLAENPDSFKVSVSGFTQERYGYTHRGGEIERVKRHMGELAQAKERSGASTRLFVSYHRYLDNLKEEPLLREFAAGLGFEFEPAWALFFPLEKVLALALGGAGAALTEEDRLLIDRLALPLDKTLACAQALDKGGCRLRDSQISLDFRGKVQLCCGLFDSATYTVGDFLGMPLDKIQQIRRSHPTCERCMALGGHRFLTYQVPEMERLILERISAEDAELLGLRREMAARRVLQSLRGVCPEALRPLFARLLGRRRRRK